MRYLAGVLVFAAGLLAQSPNAVSKTATGSITASSASCVSPACLWIVTPADTQTASVQLSGTFTATLQFESSVNGTTWAAIAASNGATSATAAGIWAFQLSGRRYLRVRASAYVAGPVRVDISTSKSDSVADSVWTDDGTTVTPPPGRNVSIGTTVLPIPVVISTSSPVTVDKTAFYVCDVAGGCTYTLPAVTASNAGLQACVWNKAGRSGAITFQLPAATQMDKEGALGTVAATTVSGGALGDMACVVAVTTGQYKLFPNKGTWTNN